MKRLLVLLAAALFLFATLAVAPAADEDEGNLKFKNLPQYGTYLKNKDDTQMTEYGGSVPH